MRLVALGWLAAFALTGCFDSHAPTCTVECANDDECPSGLTCGPSNKCSEDGAVCTDSGACTLDETRCRPGDTSVLEKCDAQGSWVMTETCALSCMTGATPAHCGHVEPTINALKEICDVPAISTERKLVGMTTLDTTDMQQCDAFLDQGQSAPRICVLRARTISFTSGSSTTFRGLAVVAVVADGDVTIDGVIDVSGTSITDGAGVSRSSGEGSMTHFGGGGAGFRTAGAPGAAGSPSGGQPGGVMAADPTLSPLLLGGFRAQSVMVTGTGGGGGGGGIAIISCKGTVTVSAMIDAGGGGGKPGGDYSVNGSDYRSGGGGGSGGVIAIQAPHISITLGGSIYANGGGGGGGSSQVNTLGGSGEEASQSDVNPAQGGTATNAGVGGKGGCATKTPTTGGADGSGVSGGGGGGSMGYSILYTPLGTLPTISAGMEPPSPPLSLATVQLR